MTYQQNRKTMTKGDFSSGLGLERELQKIYDCEVNVSITSIWDGGWRVQVGGKSPAWDFCEIDEIVPALRELMWEHFPLSTYSQHIHEASDNGDQCLRCKRDLRDEVHVRWEIAPKKQPTPLQDGK